MKKPGRPALGEKKRKGIYIKLPPKIVLFLVDKSKKLGISQSRLIERALNNQYNIK